MHRCTPPRFAGGPESMEEGGTSVDAGTVKRWLETAAASLHEQRDYLTQLDAAIGDADHGTNMDRGFTAVVGKLDGLEGPPGKLLTTAGATLVSTVGGASGPLWGTALRRAGRSLGDSEEFDGAGLLAALEEALDGGVAATDAVAAARAAAEEGMRATVPLQASKGRASYLGERSIGHQDPGATSTALILAALDRTVSAER